MLVRISEVVALLSYDLYQHCIILLRPMLMGIVTGESLYLLLEPRLPPSRCHLFNCLVDHPGDLKSDMENLQSQTMMRPQSQQGQAGGFGLQQSGRAGGFALPGGSFPDGQTPMGGVSQGPMSGG